MDKIYNQNNKNILVKYLLKIKSLRNDDFGVYNCFVNNSYGSAEFIFEIQPSCKSIIFKLKNNNNSSFFFIF